MDLAGAFVWNYVAALVNMIGNTAIYCLASIGMINEKNYVEFEVVGLQHVLSHIACHSICFLDVRFRGDFMTQGQRICICVHNNYEAHKYVIVCNLLLEQQRNNHCYLASASETCAFSRKANTEYGTEIGSEIVEIRPC